MTCPRCRGKVIRSYDELSCLACGWHPVVIDADIAREVVRKKRPGPRFQRHGGMRLN